MKRSTVARLLDRRTAVAAIAAAGVVAVAIYATNANPNTPRPVQARAAAVEQPATGLPLDVQGLIGEAQQIPADGVSPSELIQKIKELLKKYGIDPNGIQPFLDQAKAATSPQQLTADAKSFLVQHGVAAADMDELQVELQQVQQQQLDPQLIAKIVNTLIRLAKDYWWVLPIIVAVVVAAVIFGSKGKGEGQQEKKAKNGPGCGVDNASLDKDLARIATMRLTFGIGFDIPDQSMEIILASGVHPDPRSDEAATGWKLSDQGRDWLTRNKTAGTYNHAETKMATFMRLRGDQMKASGQVAVVDHMCMVINDGRGPCDLMNPLQTGCIHSVPLLLSDQWRQALTVNWKASDGNWYHVDLTNTATQDRPSPPVAPAPSGGRGEAAGNLP
jgi:hypothetical protein